MPEKMLILASASPARQLLLEKIGFKPDMICPADIDETALAKEKPKNLVLRLAIGKAAKIAEQYPDAVVLGADTIAFCRGTIMGKPADAAEARQFLQKISGRRHRIYTGICVIHRGKVNSTYAETTLKIKCMTASEIDAFIASSQWRGKAGGYTISGAFAAFVENMQGCNSTAVGLPANKAYNLLRHFLPFNPPVV